MDSMLKLELEIGFTHIIFLQKVHHNIGVKMELKEEDKLLTNDMAEAQSQNVHIQNVLFTKTGKLIPCSTICQITLQNKANCKQIGLQSHVGT